MGMDYAQVHDEAHPAPSLFGIQQWAVLLLGDEALLEEAELPAGPTNDALCLALSDLYEINNRGIVLVLEAAWSNLEFEVKNWAQRQARLHRTTRPWDFGQAPRA